MDLDHTFVEPENLKTLEEYAVYLTSGMLTLMTLQNMQVHAIKIGILPEDLAERANTIVWDVRRQLGLYQTQLEAVLELIPDGFDHQAILDRLKASELKKARSMTRRKPPEKNEN